MMKLKNSEWGFGAMAMGLHWLMAVLIIGMLGIGIYMVNIPISLQKLKLYGWHKEFGFLILALALFRLYWRLININPRLSLPLLERVAARLVHWAFYGFMLAIPLTGWLLTSATGIPTSFFGLLTIPNLIGPNKELLSWFSSIHGWLSYALIAAICMHTLAALKHHFYDKDDILRRMLP